jgi:hypothetical protein
MNWFGVCCDSDSDSDNWVKFDAARIFLSFDNSVAFCVPVHPLSGDNTLIQCMYNQLSARPIRGCCFATVAHRNNFDVDKNESSQLNCGYLLVLSCSL